MTFLRHPSPSPCPAGPAFYRDARLRMSSPALGASAAVNSVLFLSILLRPSATIYLYAIIPVPAALLGVMWLANDLSGVMQAGPAGRD